MLNRDDMLNGHIKRNRQTPKPRSRGRRAFIREAASAAALVAALAVAGPLRAQERAPWPDNSIRAVLADIARRDLDTSAGPPLNAFLTLNSNAVAQAEARSGLTRAVCRSGSSSWAARGPTKSWWP